MSDEDQLVQAGEIGDKVKAFIASEIGQLMLSAKDQDKSEAMNDMLKLNPYDYKTLGELQNAIAKAQENVMLAEKVHGYLADVIIRGEQADQLLMSQEDN